MWEAAASVPLPAAARATGWARTASGPIEQAPASRQVGRRNGGGPTSLRISSAPAPSDTRGPIPEGCHAPSWGPWPDAYPNRFSCPLRQGPGPAQARRTQPCHPRLRSTRGSRRARHLRSLGSNRPRANPVQGHGGRQSGGTCRGGELPVSRVAIKSGLRRRFPYRHLNVPAYPDANPQGIGTTCTAGAPASRYSRLPHLAKTA
jgi:hypothetical protein